MRRLFFHVEVLAGLMLASLLIAVLPFRHVARVMASGRTRPPVDPVTARQIDRALRRWAARVPWHAMCFQQGLAAQLMLRRRRRAATIHYGAAHDDAGTLVAHVWVRSGTVDVVGCHDSGRYGLLATFPDGKR